MHLPDDFDKHPFGCQIFTELQVLTGVRNARAPGGGENLEGGDGGRVDDGWESGHSPLLGAAHRQSWDVQQRQHPGQACLARSKGASCMHAHHAVLSSHGIGAAQERPAMKDPGHRCCFKIRIQRKALNIHVPGPMACCAEFC